MGDPRDLARSRGLLERRHSCPLSPPLADRVGLQALEKPDRPQYGHKLNLSTGRSGLILDLVIEPGNPADSERFLPMLKRHIAFYGEAPRQTAADGGFASRDNLAQANALGVHDAAFHKKAGLRIMDMVKSNWVYRERRNFRAGIESDIVSEARLWAGALRLAWARPLHGLRLVLSRRLQPCPLCASQADLTSLHPPSHPKPG
jgi:IS5 family transposase